MPWNALAAQTEDILHKIQHALFKKALEFRRANTVSVSSYGELQEIMENGDMFVEGHWCGKREFEDKIQEETKATIAVIPFESNPAEPGKCIYSGEDSTTKVIFAKSY